MLIQTKKVHTKFIFIYRKFFFRDFFFFQFFWNFWEKIFFSRLFFLIFIKKKKFFVYLIIETNPNKEIKKNVEPPTQKKLAETIINQKVSCFVQIKSRRVCLKVNIRFFFNLLFNWLFLRFPQKFPKKQPWKTFLFGLIPLRLRFLVFVYFFFSIQIWRVLGSKLYLKLSRLVFCYSYK